MRRLVALLLVSVTLVFVTGASGAATWPPPGKPKAVLTELIGGSLLKSHVKSSDARATGWVTRKQTVSFCRDGTWKWRRVDTRPSGRKRKRSFKGTWKVDRAIFDTYERPEGRVHRALADTLWESSNPKDRFPRMSIELRDDDPDMKDAPVTGVGSTQFLRTADGARC